jgi:hypothetical protein
MSRSAALEMSVQDLASPVGLHLSTLQPINAAIIMR